VPTRCLRPSFKSHNRWIREQVNQFGFSWVLFTLIYSPACWPLQERTNVNLESINFKSFGFTCQSATVVPLYCHCRFKFILFPIWQFFGAFFELFCVTLCHSSHKYYCHVVIGHRICHRRTLVSDFNKVWGGGEWLKK
jgi:hypothetical protein